MASFYDRNLFSAGSVVDQDPIERLHLMSGQYSPVKTKNVVPHDIGDPGRIKKTILFNLIGSGRCRIMKPCTDVL